MLRNINYNEIPISGDSDSGGPEEIEVKVVDKSKLSPEEMATRRERYLKQVEDAFELALGSGLTIEDLEKTLESARRREESGR